MPKLIPRPLHALLDYSWSVAIWFAPHLFGFENEEKANLLCKTMGAATAAASLLTRYELGLVKFIPFNTHLRLDGWGGVSGLAAPWLLGFAGNKRARNAALAFFLVEIVVVSLSRRDEESAL